MAKEGEQQQPINKPVGSDKISPSEIYAIGDFPQLQEHWRAETRSQGSVGRLGEVVADIKSIRVRICQKTIASHASRRRRGEGSYPASPGLDEVVTVLIIARRGAGDVCGPPWHLTIRLTDWPDIACLRRVIFEG